MTNEEAAPATTEEKKYHWVVMFSKDGKVYAYTSRTIPYMAAVAQKFHDDDDKGRYPYRMWVIDQGQIQKVDIS